MIFRGLWGVIMFSIFEDVDITYSVKVLDDLLRRCLMIFLLYCRRFFYESFSHDRISLFLMIIECLSAQKLVHLHQGWGFFKE